MDAGNRGEGGKGKRDVKGKLGAVCISPGVKRGLGNEGVEVAK